MKLKIQKGLLGLLFLLQPMIVWADVTFDNSSIVAQGVKNTTLTGNMTIPASSGKQLGGNLFHSFSAFNINTGQSATFIATGAVPNSINNVLSRVTGNTASNIDGLLKSTIPNADVYLINPNGITFGSHASVDVPGAFHAGTADSINLSDGKQFNASKADDALLTSSAPAAFGFLGNTATNNGKITVDGAQLNAKSSKTLDLAAGELEIKNNALLKAPSGEIRLVALKGQGTVSVKLDSDGKTPLPTATPSASNAGNITLTNSIANSDGNSGGRVAVWGNAVTLDNGAKITTSNTGANSADSAQGIDIRSNNLALKNQSAIHAEAGNTGKAVNINVTATDMNIDNSVITSTAINNSTGDAGIITVNTESLNVHNGGNISSSTDAQGNAGKVGVTAKRITVDGQNNPNLTGIYSDALTHSHGKAGIVEISTDTLDINNGGAIGSNTLSSGDAGNVNVSTNTLNIDGQNYSGYTGITSAGKIGNAGTITINSGILNIVNGARISSSTFGSGNAGAINITSNALTIDRQNSQSLTDISSEATTGSTGNAGAITINTDTLDILNDGAISTNNFGQGHGGNIAVTAKNITITGKDSSPYDESLQTGIISEATHTSSGNAGTINIKTDTLTIQSAGKISSDTQGSGNGGDISITAKNIYLDGKTSQQKTLIASDALSGSSGNAGTVTVNTNILDIKNKAQISSDTYAGGNAGNINITVNESANLNNGTIGSSSYGGGLGGSVSLTSPLLTLDNGSSISASSTTGAKGGDISIGASVLKLQNQSQISAANTGSGEAGTINITTSDSTYLTDSKISVESALGDAGGISIAAKNILYLLNSTISTSAAAGKGNGGNITIDPVFVILNSSNIIANASQGSGGNINITSSYYFASTDSVIQASSQFGLQGTVSINSSNSNIAGSIGVLPTDFTDASNLMDKQCGSGEEEARSSFTASALHNLVLPGPDSFLNYVPASMSGCGA
jgi:filamentous hemagglutinin family protein